MQKALWIVRAEGRPGPCSFKAARGKAVSQEPRKTQRWAFFSTAPAHHCIVVFMGKRGSLSLRKSGRRCIDKQEEYENKEIKNFVVQHEIFLFLYEQTVA